MFFSTQHHNSQLLFTRGLLGIVPRPMNRGLQPFRRRRPSCTQTMKIICAAIGFIVQDVKNGGITFPLPWNKKTLCELAHTLAFGWSMLSPPVTHKPPSRFTMGVQLCFGTPQPHSFPSFPSGQEINPSLCERLFSGLKRANPRIHL
jgi:hypothetical protein